TPLFAQKADKIITVSEFSRQDIIAHYNVKPSKIDVIYNGASEAYKPLSEKERAAVRNTYAQGMPYFIYVGSIHPRKNVKNLLLAFDAFKATNHTDHKLVIAGRMAWKTEETKTVYEQMQFKDAVIFTGHLQLGQIAELMGAAEALVYPSLFEGFGIPVLEARYCNVPVLCSNYSSIPEVGGENAIYFNPERIDEITAAMTNFVAHSAQYKQLFQNSYQVKKQFSWDISVDKMEQTIASMDKRFVPKLALH
ncbi:MAG: glycosyltransferase family 4 protein, partial [Chitinophagales bacterium]